MAPPPPSPPEPDYDSCSSSSTTTVPGSARSSVSSVASSSSSLKPHKAHEAAWDAMQRLKREHGGQLSLDNFRLLRRLGGGDIGNVYLCQLRRVPSAQQQQQQRWLYAMKVVDREAVAVKKNKLQRAETEKEILGSLDHPFVPTLYADFEASHFSCLVMEFCPGGDLHTALYRHPEKHFPISSAKFYAAEALLALEYLHMMGIVYRDLKPENVLVREDGHIMLSDFDLSFKCDDVVPKLLKSRLLNSLHAKRPKPNKKLPTPPSCTSSFSTPLHPVLSCILPNTNNNNNNNNNNIDNDIYDNPTLGPELVAEPVGARSCSFVGTHEYLAPEVISGQGHGAAVDWWTLGVFLYEMIYGTTPFKGENNKKTLANILKQPLRFPRIGVNSITELEEMVRVQDLVRRLLVKNPKRRIGSIKGAVEIKRHEFFKGVNWALIRSVRPPEVPKSSRANHLSKSSNKEKDSAAPKISNNHFDCF